MLDDRSPHSLNDLVMVGPAELAVELMYDDEPLAATFIGERERCAWQHGGVGLLGGLFDILWVMVAAADDDDIFHASGDVQLTFAEETQVPRAQELTFAAGNDCA